MDELDFEIRRETVEAMTHAYPVRPLAVSSAHPDPHMDYALHSAFGEHAWDEGGH